MRKRLLQIIGVVFIALLLLQSVVSLFVYDMQLRQSRRKVKWEILNRLSKAELTLVKIATVLEEHPNPFFKREHNKEFQFLGEMYDIVQQEKYADTTYYYCFHDSDESAILRNINQWMHDTFGDANRDQKSNSHKVLKDIFKQDYLPGNQSISDLNVTLSRCFFQYNRLAIYRNTPVFAPPPENFS